MVEWQRGTFVFQGMMVVLVYDVPMRCCGEWAVELELKSAHVLMCCCHEERPEEWELKLGRC